MWRNSWISLICILIIVTYDISGAVVCFSVFGGIILLNLFSISKEENVDFDYQMKDGWGIDLIIKRLADLSIMNNDEIAKLISTDLEGYDLPEFDEEAVLERWSTEKWWPLLSKGLCFEIGSRVECNWIGGGTGFRGTVTTVHGILHDIKFDDGDTEDDVPIQRLRPASSDEHNPSPLGQFEEQTLVEYLEKIAISTKDEGNWWEST